MNFLKYRASFVVITLIILQFGFTNLSFSQCVHSISPTSASIPGLGGCDYIYLTTEECEYYDAYTNDSWFYVWADYYEEIVTVYADPNNEEYREGILIIDNYNSEDDFYVPVSQEYGCEQLPSPGEITGPSTVCAGGSGNFSISPVEGASFYHWAIDGNSVSNQYGTSATLLFPTYGSSSTITACAYNDCGEGIQSSKQITLHYAPSPGTISGSQTINFNTTPSILSSTVNASDCFGQCYYQWQSSLTGTGNWTNVQGATNSTYSPGILESTVYYRRAVSDNCGTAYSNIVQITITFPETTYLSVPEIPNPETRTLNTTSYLVGATNGSFTIDQGGGASYSIPLEILPGVNGLSPNISLVYSSNSTAGVAGYGWNISGFSTINRGPQTVYHDGAARGVSMDINDRFYLDGQRLVNTSSTYGSANAQYQTENDIFSRVTPQSTDTYGPAWFKAETKSGLIYEYGNSIESKQILNGYSQVLNWYVSKISDQFNNQINFKYIQDHSNIYPEEIIYGLNTITFSYKNRTDKNISYIKGSTLEQWLLLDSITVSYNSTPVKSYKLKYSYQGPYNSYSLLNEIIEYGTGADRLNSTAISYQINASVSFSQYATNSTHEYVTYKSKLITGDFNGDGKTDLLCLPADPGNEATWTGMKVYVSDGNGNFTFYFSETTSLNLSQILDIRSLDLNGDGKDDILYEEGISGYSTFKYMLFDGSSFTEPHTIIVHDQHNSHTGLSGKVRRGDDNQERDNELTLADYNGDGINDIFLNDPNGNWQIQSFINPSGQLTSSLYSLCSGQISTMNGQVESGDFNGDGKADLWSIENNGFKIYTFNGSNLELLYSSTWLTNKHFFSLGDFNADGKVDVFLYGLGKGEETQYDWANWQIKLSTGTDFVGYSIPQKKSNLKDDPLLRSNDFNGDGATDILIPVDASGVYEYLFISNNCGTDFSTQSQVINTYSYHNYYLGDYDGDGHVDYLYVDKEDDPWWNGYQIWKTSGNSKTLIEKIGNELGVLTSLSCTKLSQNSNYVRGTGAIFPVSDFQGPLTVVSSIQVDNGKGTMNTQNYYYEGAKIHLQGKGFLGYAKTKTSDIASGIESENISGYNSTYFYPQLLLTLSKRSGTTDTISKVKNTWSQVVLDASTKRIFPYMQSSVQTNKLAGQSVTMNASYDSYGNPTSTTKVYSNGISETNTYTYDNTVSSSLWLLGRPTATTVQYADSSNTITRSGTSVFNSNNNLLTSETWYSGTNNQIAHTYRYNSVGSLLSDTTTANGVSRSKNITYESDNIRIHTSTDQLSHVTTNTYDSYGRLSSVQDYLGNAVTYQYDDFDRQISVSSNDGSQGTTVLGWEDPYATPSLARYSVVKTANDGSQTKSWYDKLGRIIRSDVKGFDGTMIYTSTVYNTKGQIESISDPYFSTSSALLNTFQYDNYGRKTNQNRPSGRNSSWEYNNSTVTETTADQSFSKVFNADGTMSSSTDAGGTILYTYYPDGKVDTITAPGTIITSMQYDLAGNQTQLNDPSAGIITYTYNGFGELTSQTNAKNQTTSISYNPEGTISQKVTPEGTTTYSYNSNKQLTGISSTGSGVSRSFTYDNNNRRIISTSETIPGSSSFTTSFTYDGLGRISTLTHPSGIVETKNYNSNGYLSSVSAGGAVRWTISSINAKQQVTSGQYGSNLGVTFGYDAYGFPTSTITDTIQNYSYNFNPVTNNLNWRQNNKYSNLREDFQYDNLDRLDNVHMGTTLTLDMAYDTDKGGITTKSDVGVLHYDTSTKPYQVSSINSSTGLIPSSEDTLTWTSFEKVSTISENNDSAAFIYNSDDERARMVVLNALNTVLIRWYPSSNYIKETAGSVTKEFTFIGGDAYTAPVVAITQSGTTIYYNLLRDYLGNITHVVNSSNNTVVAEYSYDAWGRTRNPATWENNAPGSEPVLIIAGRGFTGHEHLPWFNLINMNGRVYDPIIAMFLSPDNFIQTPDLTINFNRYSYCLNNPLVYTDPDGKFIFSLLCAIIPGLQPLLPIAIAADIGGVMNVALNAKNIHNTGQFFGYYGIGAAAGAAGAGVGLGVSSALAGGSFLGGVMGTSTVVSTGFTSGFVSGAAGGFSGGFINGFGNAAMNRDNNFGDMLSAGWNSGWKGGLFGGVAGGIAGGIDAVKHDRNFWTGSGKQGVVVKVNTQGNGELIGEQDYNAPYTPPQTQDYYRTQLSNNGSVTTASNGQITIKIPNNVDRITGIAAPDNTFFTNVNIGRNALTLTPLDKTSYVILHGWRYYSNPVTSFKDIFYWRPKFF